MNMCGTRMLSGLIFTMMALGAPLSATTAAPTPSVSVKKAGKKTKIITCDQYSREVLLGKAKKYQKIIHAAAREYHISPNLITAVIAVESCFRPRARSYAGAAGLMQLMPGTAKRFGVKDRYNHEHNIMAGTKYLKFLMNRFSGNIVLTSAAYNAGEGAVDKYNGIPPYRQTQAYVKKVLAVYRKLGKPQNPQQLAQQRHQQALLKRRQLAQQASRHNRHQRPLSLTLPELNEAYKLLADERYEPVLNFKQFL